MSWRQLACRWHGLTFSLGIIVKVNPILGISVHVAHHQGAVHDLSHVFLFGRDGDIEVGWRQSPQKICHCAPHGIHHLRLQVDFMINVFQNTVGSLIGAQECEVQCSFRNSFDYVCLMMKPLI